MVSPRCLRDSNLNALTTSNQCGVDVGLANQSPLRWISGLALGLWEAREPLSQPRGPSRFNQDTDPETAPTDVGEFRRVFTACFRI
jgi:hypothetical protein